MTLFTDFERDPDKLIGVKWDDFVAAVYVLYQTNDQVLSVEDIANAFNTTPLLVEEAVSAHPELEVTPWGDHRGFNSRGVVLDAGLESEGGVDDERSFAAVGTSDGHTAEPTYLRRRVTGGFGISR